MRDMPGTDETCAMTKKSGFQHDEKGNLLGVQESGRIRPYKYDEDNPASSGLLQGKRAAHW